MSFVLNKKTVFILGALAVAGLFFFIFPGVSFATCKTDGIDCSQCTNAADVAAGECEPVYGDWSYPDGECTSPWETCNNYVADCPCVNPATCGQVQVDNVTQYACVIPLELSCEVKCSVTEGTVCSVGEFVTWSVTDTGGISGGTNQYLWSGNGVEGLGSNSNGGTAEATQPGTLYGKVKVTRTTSGGATQTAYCPLPPNQMRVQIVAPIEVSLIAKSVSCLSGVPGNNCQYFLGEGITWEVQTSGGAGEGTFSYNWSGDLGTRSSFSSVSPTTGVINYTSIGAKKVTVTAVSEGAGEKSIEISINLDERPVQISCTPSITDVDIGLSHTFTSDGQYGSGNYDITWSMDGAASGEFPEVSYNNVSTLRSSVSHTFDRPGVGGASKDVRVKVDSLDSDGDVRSSAEATCEVTVKMVGFNVSCGMTPADGKVAPDGSVQFTAVPSGGIGNYTYTDYGWEIKDSSGAVVADSVEWEFSHPFATVGTYTATLSALHYNAEDVLIGEASCDDLTVVVATLPPPPPVCGRDGCQSTENQTNCPLDCGCPGNYFQSGNRCFPVVQDKPFVPSGQINIPNPLCEDPNDPSTCVTDIPGLFAKISDVLVKFLTPLIVVFFIISGLMFITARGNPAKLETAKKALLFTAIGAGVILGAWAFANMIKEVLGG